MNRARTELLDYRSTHPEFEVVGRKMAAAWSAGLAKRIAPE
jgi:serine/threonine-protein kinase HipA